MPSTGRARPITGGFTHAFELVEHALDFLGLTFSRGSDDVVVAPTK